MPRKFAPSLDYRPRTAFVPQLEWQPHVPRRVDVLFTEQAWAVVWKNTLSMIHLPDLSLSPIREHRRWQSLLARARAMRERGGNLFRKGN
jgi:hypothetical protein